MLRRIWNQAGKCSMLTARFLSGCMCLNVNAECGPAIPSLHKPRRFASDVCALRVYPGVYTLGKFGARGKPKPYVAIFLKRGTHRQFPLPHLGDLRQACVRPPRSGGLLLYQE